MPRIVAFWYMLGDLVFYIIVRALSSTTHEPTHNTLKLFLHNVYTLLCRHCDLWPIQLEQPTCTVQSVIIIALMYQRLIEPRERRLISYHNPPKATSWGKHGFAIFLYLPRKFVDRHAPTWIPTARQRGLTWDWMITQQHHTAIEKAEHFVMHKSTQRSSIIPLESIRVCIHCPHGGAVSHFQVRI